MNNACRCWLYVEGDVARRPPEFYANMIEFPCCPSYRVMWQIRVSDIPQAHRDNPLFLLVLHGRLHIQEGRELFSAWDVKDQTGRQIAQCNLPAVRESLPRTPASLPATITMSPQARRYSIERDHQEAGLGQPQNLLLDHELLQGIGDHHIVGPQSLRRLQVLI